MVNIKIVIETGNFKGKSSTALSAQEFVQLRNQINYITQDILDPPFVKVEDKSETESNCDFLQGLIFGESYKKKEGK